ncbi:MAG: FAD-dependent oxidoreductase [Bacteroidota bacterium]
MYKNLLLICLLLKCTAGFAETIRTDVLVVGGGAGGVAAAIQSARSKIKTLLVEQGPWLGGSATSGGMCIITENRNQASGIYAEFRSHIREFYKPRLGYDTTRNAALVFEPATGASILKKTTDTVKNLTVKLNTPFSAIKKDGTDWVVIVMDNGKPLIIKAKIVVDATELGDVAAGAGALLTSGFDSRQDTKEALAPDNATNQIQDISYLAILKDFGKAADRSIPQPEGYNAAQYACLKTADIKKLLAQAVLPNDRYLINWENCGNQYSVTADDLKPENREATFRKARLRTLGLIYYLQTALGYKNLGFADDFKTTDHLPYLPYIRENRRAAGIVRMVLDDIYTPYNRQSKLYRTSIGVADALPGQHYSVAGVPHIAYPPFPAFSVPLGAIVAKDQENLLVLEKALSVTHLVNGAVTNPAVQMTIGQGAGATAAFCIFFKRSTKQLDVRTIQGEILDHKGSLMPFADIPQTDRDFRAIQQVAATGMIQGIQKPYGQSAQVLFMPDSATRTGEVQLLLTELYSRAFIWFNKEKPGEVFTLGNLLSYISEMTLRDPAELQEAIRKTWKSYYHFNTPFNLKRPATRREFAVLANRFFNPFARTVDITGKLVD